MTLSTCPTPQYLHDRIVLEESVAVMAIHLTTEINQNGTKMQNELAQSQWE